MTGAPALELHWSADAADVSPALRAALVRCWRDVVNGGGAVGFAEQVPVSDAEMAPAVDALVAGLDPRLRRLLVATRGPALAGWLVLHGNADPVTAHWGRITHVQTAPGSRGTGVGGALLTELARSAREDLGLESLRLEVRGGMGLEDFYGRYGWTVTGCWPGALQFTAHGRRDEVLMGLDLVGSWP